MVSASHPGRALLSVFRAPMAEVLRRLVLVLLPWAPRHVVRLIPPTVAQRDDVVYLTLVASWRLRVGALERGDRIRVPLALALAVTGAPLALGRTATVAQNAAMPAPRGGNGACRHWIDHRHGLR
jgi:hypothetical protein